MRAERRAAPKPALTPAGGRTPTPAVGGLSLRAERRATIGQRPMLLARRRQSAGTAGVRAQLAKPALTPAGGRAPTPAIGGLT